MRDRAGSVFARAQIFMILLLVTAGSSLAASRHDLSLSYSVAEEAGSGPLVHVSLHLVLANHGQDAIRVRRLTIHHVHPVGQVKQFAATTVQPHSSVQITQELTFRRLEFERWQKDPGPTLLLEVQSPGDKFMEAILPDKAQSEK